MPPLTVRPAVPGTVPRTGTTPAPEPTAPAPGPAEAPRADGFATAGGARGLLDRARDGVTHYFDNTTNRTTASLTAVRAGLSGAGLLLRGLPVIGNVVNAARAVLSLAKACVQTDALLDHKPQANRNTVIAAWANVATDVAGIFFPPIGLAGGVGVTAYSVYDAVSSRDDAPPRPQAPG